MRVAILGTGGNCIDILDAMLEINRVRGEAVYECAGFFDDAPGQQGKRIHGVPVLGPLAQAGRTPDLRFVYGIGSVRNFRERGRIRSTCGVPDDGWETIVHPSAQVSTFASVGPGSIVLQNAVIAAGARIGACVMVLPTSIVSHDSVVGDFTIIAGGVCINGAVTIGGHCYLGSGTQVRERLKIGDRTLCAMGSVVVQDVAAGATVGGVPAQPFEPKTGRPG
jgi:sugar O-acyltransferase (sialic acid O-acetyltransferase NeuD family)